MRRIPVVLVSLLLCVACGPLPVSPAFTATPSPMPTATFIPTLRPTVSPSPTPQPGSDLTRLAAAVRAAPEYQSGPGLTVGQWGKDLAAWDRARRAPGNNFNAPAPLGPWGIKWIDDSHENFYDDGSGVLFEWPFMFDDPLGDSSRPGTLYANLKLWLRLQGTNPAGFHTPDWLAAILRAV